MRSIKQIIAAITMTGIIILSTSFANAGIVVAGSKKDTPGTSCSQTLETGKVNSGIVVAGFVGIVVAGFTGIVVAGAVNSPISACGIVVAG